MRFCSPRLVQPGTWCWTWMRCWIWTTLKSLPLVQMLMLEIYTSIVIHLISIFLAPIIYQRSEGCNYATNHRLHELCQNNSSCSWQTWEIAENHIHIGYWPQTRVIWEYESHIERIGIGERKLGAIIYTTIQHYDGRQDSAARYPKIQKSDIYN